MPSVNRKDALTGSNNNALQSSLRRVLSSFNQSTLTLVGSTVPLAPVESSTSAHGQFIHQGTSNVRANVIRELVRGTSGETSPATSTLSTPATSAEHQALVDLCGPTFPIDHHKLARSGGGLFSLDVNKPRANAIRKMARELFEVSKSPVGVQAKRGRIGTSVKGDESSMILDEMVEEMEPLGFDDDSFCWSTVTEAETVPAVLGSIGGIMAEEAWRLLELRSSEQIRKEINGMWVMQRELEKSLAMVRGARATYEACLAKKHPSP